MRNPNRGFSVLGLIVLAGIMVLPGCASRKYVRQQVGTLQPPIQEAQNAIKENAERIDAVDRRAQQGITAAQTAAQAADQKRHKLGSLLKLPRRPPRLPIARRIQPTRVCSRRPTGSTPSRPA